MNSKIIKDTTGYKTEAISEGFYPNNLVTRIDEWNGGFNYLTRLYHIENCSVLVGSHYSASKFLSERIEIFGKNLEEVNKVALKLEEILGLED
jgi:hypothetical protein